MTLIGSVGAPTRLPTATDIGFLLAVASLVLLWRLIARPVSVPGAGSDRGGDPGGREQGEHGEDGAHRGADAAHPRQPDEAQ
mgnify:CR=1 FL=1